MTIATIGVYGFSAAAFIDTLRAARVAAVIDIRRRRGMRGATYAFANATALEALVTAHGIGYFADARLAPTHEIRAVQTGTDVRRGIRAAERRALAPAYVAAYRADVLDHYGPDDAAALLARAGGTPALLCVEEYPAACHRSLAAAHLAALTGAQVQHLWPPEQR